VPQRSGKTKGPCKGESAVSGHSRRIQGGAASRSTSCTGGGDCDAPSRRRHATRRCRYPHLRRRARPHPHPSASTDLDPSVSHALRSRPTRTTTMEHSVVVPGWEGDDAHNDDLTTATVRPLAFHATWKPIFNISSISSITFHVARFLRDSLYTSNIRYNGLHLFSGSYGHADRPDPA